MEKMWFFGLSFLHNCFDLVFKSTRETINNYNVWSKYVHYFIFSTRNSFTYVTYDET